MQFAQVLLVTFGGVYSSKQHQGHASEIRVPPTGSLRCRWTNCLIQVLALVLARHEFGMSRSTTFEIRDACAFLITNELRRELSYEAWTFGWWGRRWACCFRCVGFECSA